MVRSSASTGIPWNEALSSALVARSVRTTVYGTPDAAAAAMAGVSAAGGPDRSVTPARDG